MILTVLLVGREWYPIRRSVGDIIFYIEITADPEALNNAFSFIID